MDGLIYGTAWKEDRTEELTRLALSVGFRVIDTANQRRHYVEADVGAAVAASGLPRGELYLQTKFTYVRGQDHRLPYDPRADIATQVRQSFERSLAHLGVETIDSFLLHGPWGAGWSAEDREAWAAMEALRRAGRVGAIGVSNVSLDQLERLCASAAIAPAAVQNRCFASTGWDRDVRAFCRGHGITYQGFSLLTANRRELASSAMRALATRLGATVPQVVFRWALAVGMRPLTGTSDRTHMLEDLSCTRIELAPADLEAVERIGDQARGA